MLMYYYGDYLNWVKKFIKNDNVLSITLMLKYSRKVEFNINRCICHFGDVR